MEARRLGMGLGMGARRVGMGLGMGAQRVGMGLGMGAPFQETEESRHFEWFCRIVLFGALKED